MIKWTTRGWMSIPGPALAGVSTGLFSIGERKSSEDGHIYYCLIAACSKLSRGWNFSSKKACREFAERVVRHYDLYDYVIGVERPSVPESDAFLGGFDAIRDRVRGVEATVED